MVHIYAIAYNEEVLLEKMINHYRSKFPNCSITIYDNQSTDRTREIAESLGCTVIEYNSNNEIRDDLYLKIKNNCWKNQTERWAVVCDVDELIYINEQELLQEQQEGSTIIRFEAYNMISLNQDPNAIDINLTVGWRFPFYDKFYLFDTFNIQEINYEAGCHSANPVGHINHSKNVYLMCHFKGIGLNYLLNRYKMYKSRLSEINKKYSWGVEYNNSEDQIKIDWITAQNNSNNKVLLNKKTF